MARNDQDSSVPRLSRTELVELGLNRLPASAVIIFDLDLRFVLVRGGAILDNDMKSSQFEGRLAKEALPPERFELHKPMYEAALAGKTIQYNTTSPDGNRHYSLSCNPIVDSDGIVVGGSLSATEISELWASEQRESESAARFQLAMDSAPIGMAVVSMDRVFLDVNEALCRMLGKDENSLLGHSLDDVIHPGDRESDLEVRARVRAGDEKWGRTEKRLVRSDGSDVWVNHSVGLVTGNDGEPRSYISQFADMTETHARQSALENLAETDPLTGLPHRRALVRTLQVLSPDSAESRVTILFVDIDDFKVLNDTHGHQAGDQAIIAVAGRLKSHVRSGDTIARYGGDEFVIVTRTPLAEVSAVCTRLLASFTNPIHLDVANVNVSISIGAAVSVGEDYETVLGRADKCLYKAKEAGGNSFVISAGTSE